MADEDKVARIITEPRDYDIDLRLLLTARLTSVYFNGLSIIRQGASDEDIIRVISRQLSGEGVVGLFGAAILNARDIRNCGQPAKHFCIYDTDAPGLESHADVTGTFDATLSRSAWKKAESTRRAALRDILGEHLVRATTPEALLSALRNAGI